MEEHGHSGARHQKDIDIVEKSVNKGQTKGAAEDKKEKIIRGISAGIEGQSLRYKCQDRS
jgi:hypothetical protein